MLSAKQPGAPVFREMSRLWWQTQYWSLINMINSKLLAIYMVHYLTRKDSSLLSMWRQLFTWQGYLENIYWWENHILFPLQNIVKYTSLIYYYININKLYPEFCFLFGVSESWHLKPRRKWWSVSWSCDHVHYLPASLIVRQLGVKR